MVEEGGHGEVWNPDAMERHVSVVESVEIRVVDVGVMYPALAGITNDWDTLDVWRVLLSQNFG